MMIPMAQTALLNRTRTEIATSTRTLVSLQAHNTLCWNAIAFEFSMKLYLIHNYCCYNIVKAYNVS